MKKYLMYLAVESPPFESDVKIILELNERWKRKISRYDVTLDSVAAKASRDSLDCWTQTAGSFETFGGLLIAKAWKLKENFLPP